MVLRGPCFRVQMGLARIDLYSLQRRAVSFLVFPTRYA